MKKLRVLLFSRWPNQGLFRTVEKIEKIQSEVELLPVSLFTGLAWPPAFRNFHSAIAILFSLTFVCT